MVSARRCCHWALHTWQGPLSPRLSHQSGCWHCGLEHVLAEASIFSRLKQAPRSSALFYPRLKKPAVRCTCAEKSSAVGLLSTSRCRVMNEWKTLSHTAKVARVPALSGVHARVVTCEPHRMPVQLLEAFKVVHHWWTAVAQLSFRGLQPCWAWQRRTMAMHGAVASRVQCRVFSGCQLAALPFTSCTRCAAQRAHCGV